MSRSLGVNAGYLSPGMPRSGPRLSPSPYGSTRVVKHPGERRRDWLSAHFRELEELAGGFATTLDRRDANMVAYLWVEWRQLLEDLEVARRQREEGKGRRTSAAQMARYQKRLGLALADYTAARTCFEERVKGNGHRGPSRDPLAALLAATTGRPRD